MGIITWGLGESGGGGGSGITLEIEVLSEEGLDIDVGSLVPAETSYEDYVLAMTPTPQGHFVLSESAAPLDCSITADDATPLGEVTLAANVGPTWVRQPLLAYQSVDDTRIEVNASAILSGWAWSSSWAYNIWIRPTSFVAGAEHVALYVADDYYHSDTLYITGNTQQLHYKALSWGMSTVLNGPVLTTGQDYMITCVRVNSGFNYTLYMYVNGAFYTSSGGFGPWITASAPPNWVVGDHEPAHYQYFNYETRYQGYAGELTYWLGATMPNAGQLANLYAAAADAEPTLYIAPGLDIAPQQIAIDVEAEPEP